MPAQCISNVGGISAPERSLSEERSEKEGHGLREQCMASSNGTQSPVSEPVEWIGRKNNALRRMMRKVWVRALKKEGTVKKWRARYKRGVWRVKQQFEERSHGPAVLKGAENNTGRRMGE